MKTVFRLILLLLLVVGWGLAALSLHVVRTGKERVVLIPKQRLSITDTYVDARKWTIDEVIAHPKLLERIIQSGQAEQFSYVVGDPEGNVIQQLEEALRSAPKPEEHEEKVLRKHAAAAAKAALSQAGGKNAKQSNNWWDLGG